MNGWGGFWVFFVVVCLIDWLVGFFCCCLFLVLLLLLLAAFVGREWEVRFGLDSPNCRHLRCYLKHPQ